MSWTGSAPYPPPPAGMPARRSRSRSPYRGGAPYPPRPEPAYGDYRADWEAYDRDRAWADYERDRAAYDYGRRRSRSPLGEDGRKRRRSQSPYDGRYDPRPRYDAYEGRGYDRSAPHRGGYGSHGGGRHAPPDPHTFDYPASLKQFAEWFRYTYPKEAAEEDALDKAAEQEAGDGSKPRNGLRSKWEKYKKDFAGTQLLRMFEHHRKSPWFAEKYDPSPEFTDMRSRVRKIGWRGRLTAFITELEAGSHDPDLSQSNDDNEPSSPVKEEGPDQSTEAANIGEDVKAEPEEAQMEDDGGDNDTSKPEQAEASEINGKNIADTRRVARGEEVSVMPDGNQVMIRTIPPDIGRAKLEEACAGIPGFVYLALGEPLQKKNFYRAGWLKFSEDADMLAVMSELTEKKIEGFKLHVTHNTKPFINRIKYAPEVASRPDRLRKDLENVRTLVIVLQNEASRLRAFRQPKVSDTATNGDANGDAHDGDADADMTGSADRVKQEDEELELEPEEPGSEAVERRIAKLMEDFVQSGLVDPSDTEAFEDKKNVVALDLYLAYLRAAFSTCYYCAIVTDHPEELQRKCIKHMRKPIGKAMLEEYKASQKKDNPDTPNGEHDVKVEDTDEKDKEPEGEKEREKPSKDKVETRDWKRNDERWLDWLDNKVALLINRDGVDPRDYGGKSYDEELSKAVEPFIKQEDEGKFRCKTCQKLFKATSFVEKHIINKHAETLKNLDDIPYFNNFALDPHRIQPFSHPPPQMGNQPPPPQAYGFQAPPPYAAADYGRGNPYYGAPYPAGGYPPPPGYGGNGFWPMPDPYMQAYAYGHGGGGGNRRLSDRLGGFAAGFDGPGDVHAPPVGAAAGLPAKPQAVLEPGPGSGGGGNRRGRSATGPPPPPPPDAKEDPRAAAGRKVSYHDMDSVAEGDVELAY